MPLRQPKLRMAEPEAPKADYSKVVEAGLDSAVSMALGATNYPALPRPSIGAVANSPAEISMETYRITVDPANFPATLENERDAKDYLNDLVWHEVDHYAFCPGSGENAAYLMAKAIKGLNKPTPEKAKAVLRFFVDAVDDVHRHNKPTYKMPLRDDERLPAFGRRVEAELHKKSKIGRIFLRTMEKGMGRDLDLGPLDDESENYADRAYELISSCSAGINRKNWGHKIYRLGKLLSPILDQENEASQFQQGEGGGDVKVEPQKTNLSAAADELSPEQFKTLIDALSEEKTTDDAKDQADKDAARDDSKAGEPESKFKLPPESLKAWYRSRVRQRVQIEENSIKFSGGKEIKEPVQFRIGEDPIEELDPFATIANFGTITPATLSMGFAKKYRREGTEYEQKAEPATPNVLIVHDASGSMDGHKHGTSTEMATLSGYEVAYYVVGHGSLVGVINSSKNSHCLPPTKNLGDIEDYLTVWQNDDTILPTGQLEEELELFPKDKPVHTVLVTDTAVHNLREAIPSFKKAVERGGLSVFAIRSKINAKGGVDLAMVAAFEEIGADFHDIGEIGDLEGLMLKSVKI